MSAFLVDEAGDGRYVTLNIDRNLLAVPTPDDHGYVFTNEEAAELLELLDKQIGEWAREMGRARRAVAAGVTLEEFVGDEQIEDGEWEDILDAGDQRRKEARESG